MAFMKKLVPLSGVGLAATAIGAMNKKKKDNTTPSPSLITEGSPPVSGSLVTGTSSSLY